MKVLVADDDSTGRLVLKSAVAKLGHQVETVVDGDAAWARIAQGDIDVLLTDWMMPGLDGPTLCRRVRQQAADQYVYIVLTTGMDHPEDVLAGMNAGADDYLVKPVDPFSVQTRLIAAERVTALQRQVTAFRSQLEAANQSLSELSLTDVLTGLGNRRRMEEDLERAHTRALRSKRPYSVALFDIDHFKLYNDLEGHQAGDDALRNVAQWISEVARSGESTYRYGGEEFLVLIEEAATEQGIAVAQRMRNAVESHHMPHRSRPTDPPVVTVSVGVASWTSAGATSVDHVVAEADRALFRAKDGGRNRVEVSMVLASPYP